jgi:WxcM-like protein
MKTSLEDVRLINLPKISRHEGSITPVEGGRDIPFAIARVYYLYDIPGGEARGGHAHKELQQLIVSVLGSFRVVVDDGSNRRIVTLDRSYYGLYVPRLIWRELEGFSSGAVCLVLASRPYEADDYIRSYDEFLRFRGDERTVS